MQQVRGSKRTDLHSQRQGQRQGRGWSILLQVVFAALALTGVVAMQRSRLNAPPASLSDLKQAEQQEAWRLRFLKQMPTFGFDNLVASWTFLNFLQYYGDTAVRQQTGYSLSPDYFDIITRLDPKFVDSYLFLSGSVSYQLGQPELAMSFMQRGTAALTPQAHPRAYLVWRFKGLDSLLLLGDIPTAIQAHDMAAKWAIASPDREVAPIYQQTADFLRRDPNSQLARFQAWSMVYYQAVASKDKQTQARAQQELLNLGARMQETNGRVVFTLPRSAELPAPKPPQPAPTQTPALQ